jgi:hypothetical protein
MGGIGGDLTVVLDWNSLGGTGENDENPQSGEFTF